MPAEQSHIATRFGRGTLNSCLSDFDRSICQGKCPSCFSPVFISTHAPMPQVLQN